MIISWADLEVLARTLYGEARGEMPLGKRAVAHVIFNRLQHAPRFGSTIAEVCQQPWQFSCWLPSDPNSAVIKAATISQLADCIVAAVEAIEEDDFTKGSTHYYADTMTPPKWAAGHVPVVTIGHHRFFNDVN